MVGGDRIRPQAGQRRGEGIRAVVVPGGLLLGPQLDAAVLEGLHGEVQGGAPVPGEDEGARADRPADSQAPVQARGAETGPVDPPYADPFDVDRLATAVGDAADADDAVLHRGPGRRVGVGGGERGVRQGGDGPVEVEVPVVERRFEARRFVLRREAEVPGEGLFRDERRIPPVVDRLPTPALDHRREVGGRGLVDIVQRRRAESGLHRSPQREEVREFPDRRRLGVPTVGEVVSLVMGRDLRVETLPEFEGELGEDRVRGLPGVVRRPRGGEGEGAGPDGAAGVSRRVAGMARQVAGLVGPSARGDAAEPVPRGIADGVAETPVQRRVGGEEVGTTAHHHFFVDPGDEFRRVRQVGPVVRIRRIRERRSRLRRVLHSVAERVEVQAGALARADAVRDRPQSQAGRRLRVHDHGHAAVGPAETPVGEELPPGVFRRVSHRAGRPGVHRAEVVVESGPAEFAAEGGGETPGDALPGGDDASGAGVSDQPTEEVPGPAAVRVERVPGGIGHRGVPREERLPPGVFGADDLDLVELGDRAERRRRLPLGDAGVGPKPFQPVVAVFPGAAGDLEEGARLPRRVDHRVPGLVAEPATAERPVGVTAEGLARRVEESRRGGEAPFVHRARSGHDEGARFADSGPAPAPVGIGAEHEVAFAGFQFLPTLVLEGRQDPGAPEPPPPDSGEAGVAAAGVVLVRRVRLQTLEAVAGDEVHHAADRVRAVDRAGAFLEDIHPFEGDAGNRVHIHMAPAGQLRRDIGAAAAVEQHQRARGAEPAEVHRRHRLRHIRGPAGPGVHFAEDAAADRQVLEEVDELRRALLREGVPVQHRDGGGGINRGFPDGGAGYLDLLGVAEDEVGRGQFFRLPFLLGFLFVLPFVLGAVFRAALRFRSLPLCRSVGSGPGGPPERPLPEGPRLRCALAGRFRFAVRLLLALAPFAGRRGLFRENGGGRRARGEGEDRRGQARGRPRPKRHRSACGRLHRSGRVAEKRPANPVFPFRRSSGSGFRPVGGDGRAGFRAARPGRSRRLRARPSPGGAQNL